jgi:hypothetical protein
VSARISINIHKRIRGFFADGKVQEAIETQRITKCYTGLWILTESLELRKQINIFRTECQESWLIEGIEGQLRRGCSGQADDSTFFYRNGNECHHLRTGFSQLRKWEQIWGQKFLLTALALEKLSSEIPNLCLADYNRDIYWQLQWLTVNKSANGEEVLLSARH